MPKIQTESRGVQRYKYRRLSTSWWMSRRFLCGTAWWWVTSSSRSETFLAPRRRGGELSQSVVLVSGRSSSSYPLSRPLTILFRWWKKLWKRFVSRTLLFGTFLAHLLSASLEVATTAWDKGVSHFPQTSKNAQFVRDSNET